MQLFYKSGLCYSVFPAKGSSHWKRLLLVMKLLSLFLFAACLHAAAFTKGQTVTLKEKDATLEKIFREINRQTGFDFLYSSDALKSARKVTISVKDAPVQQVLQLCLHDQPFTFTIKEKTILVKEKPIVLREEIVVAPLPPPFEVTGRVLDSTGAALAGATIMVKNTRTGTETDMNGSFTLKDIASDAILVISFTGYFTKEVRLNGNTSVTVVLLRNVNPLDEIQVIAYGTTTKRLNTGNVTTVKASEIAKQPVNNPLFALAGRVPGMFIEQTTGMPGSGTEILIQGRNSIGNGNLPFFIIDGVPYTSQLIGGVGSIFGGPGAGSGSPLQYINPADIESIDVLKDADATAIYGSRAANGAILITTKKGKAGRTKVDVDLQTGWAKVTRKLKLLNTEQYLEMRREGFKNDNATVGPTDYDVNGTWDPNRYTDWQKELIGGAARTNLVSASVSGGNTTTQFLAGATYRRETNVYPGDFANTKGSFFFNGNNTSRNQKFRIQISGSYMVDENRYPLFGVIGHILLPPNAPPLYTEDGELNWAPDANGNSTWDNPVAGLRVPVKSKTNNLVSRALIGYTIIPGLTIQANLGYTNMQTDGRNKFSLNSTRPENRPYSQRIVIYDNKNINSWLVEPQIMYNKAILKGNLEVLIGASIQQNNTGSVSIWSSGYNSDIVVEDLTSATTVIVTENRLVYKYNGLFGRLKYNWDDKYIVDLTARRDGSSRFGKENRFHNFGAIGAAWLFTKEEFISNSLPFLSFGKLRLSYGTTGNDQIADYSHLSLYNTQWAAIPYQGVKGILPTNPANPFLQWEETKKLQFGLDLGFINDRILINANYAINRSSNQLLSYPLPLITGYWSIARNFPATVQNTGWELTLNTVNIRTKDFSWTTSANITFPKNKLVKFPNIETSSFAQQLIIGEPITISKLYDFVGVDPATGLYQFTSSEGKLTSDPNWETDRFLLYNPDPRFYGGFDNTFQYKRFELSIFFQFTKQVGQNYSITSAGTFGNQLVDVLKRWQKPGDISPIQRFTATNPAEVAIPNGAAWDSKANNKDASYARLKNLSFSWQVPDEWAKKAKVDNCRISLQAQNILTITGYTGLDPETRSMGTLPPLRVINLALRVGF